MVYLRNTDIIFSTKAALEPAYRRMVKMAITAINLPSVQAVGPVNLTLPDLGR